jgi:hypothetical protein
MSKAGSKGFGSFVDGIGKKDKKQKHSKEESATKADAGGDDTVLF